MRTIWDMLKCKTGRGKVKDEILGNLKAECWHYFSQSPDEGKQPPTKCGYLHEIHGDSDIANAVASFMVYYACFSFKEQKVWWLTQLQEPLHLNRGPEKTRRQFPHGRVMYLPVELTIQEITSYLFQSYPFFKQLLNLPKFTCGNFGNGM